MRFLLLLFLVTKFFHAWGHGDEDHSKQVKNMEVSIPDNQLEKKYVKINQRYIDDVKPIFQRSCFDCHGNTTAYPWYYIIPGVKQMIDSDIKESKKHLDFSNDFPFISHETPIKDLDAINKSIKDGSMPPFSYQVMHGDKKLTKDEVKQVERWIRQSKEILK